MEDDGHCLEVRRGEPVPVVRLWQRVAHPEERTQVAMHADPRLVVTESFIAHA